MVLLDKMVQPLAQPSKLASGTTENDNLKSESSGENYSSSHNNPIG